MAGPSVPAAALPVLPSTGQTPSADPKRRLRQACQDFESVFLYKLLEQMRATIPQEGELHAAGEGVYTAICDQQVAATLAKGRGIGLADMLYRQLSASHLTHPASPGGKEAAATQAGPTQPTPPQQVNARHSNRQYLDFQQLNPRRGQGGGTQGR